MRLALMLLVLALAACGGAPLAQPSRGDASIYVVAHGWHTGVALRRADIPRGRWPESEHFAGATYVEAGWGDRDYYMAPGFNAWYAFKAIAWPTASVLHVAGFERAPAREFAGREVIELGVTRSGLDGLIAYIAESLERQGREAAVPLGGGLYGEPSAFFRSRESFHLFKTCNVWTARALRAAGLPIESGLTTESILSQARALSSSTARRRRRRL